MKTRNQNGQGLIEYLILVALIAVGTMGAIRVVGHSLKYKFGSIAESLDADVKGNKTRPVINESVWRKNDMGDFMNGSGHGQGEN